MDSFKLIIPAGEQEASILPTLLKSNSAAPVCRPSVATQLIILVHRPVWFRSNGSGCHGENLASLLAHVPKVAATT